MANLGCRKSYVGQRFGKLTTLEWVKHNGIVHYRCICDCGNEKLIRYSSLKGGHANSCGCIKSEMLRKRFKDYNDKHRVSLDNNDNDRVIVVEQYYRRNAKVRHLKWNLTRKDVLHIIFKPCTYCGSSDDQNGVGIDRVDNTKGYILDNIVPCCFTCNSSKNDMMLEEFKAWVKRVYERIVK